MKAKSLIKLCIVAVLIVVVAFLALNGMQVGKYILKPVSRAIRLGLDLRGGVSTEYIAVDTSVENFDTLLNGTVAALRTRLTNAGFTEATVAIQGSDRILVEIPDVDDPEISFRYMNETDDLLMERFAEDSQIMMIFGEDVTQERRKLFWLEAANV